MALLNFAAQYSDIEKYLNLPEPEIVSGDYVKLFFTKDGHIVTHGTDYTPLFGAEKKGLVNGSTGKQEEVLRGNNTWAAITTADLPMAKSLSDISNNTLFSSQQVEERVNQIISASDALIYKGTIKQTDTGYETVTPAGKTSSFPKTCSVGDTYRIIKAGVYAGYQCEVGDLLSAILDGPKGEESLNQSKYWTAVQTNINGEARHSVNGTLIPTYSSDPQTAFSIYAPTSGGTEGYVLLSKGTSAPTWANQSSIIAGGLTDTAKKGLFSNLSLSDTGALSITVGGTTKTATAAGTWNISINGSAGRLNHSLSVAGNGITMGQSDYTFNGQADRTITLLAATTSTIGGVKTDNSTISIEGDGKIHLTQQNIVNALGFMPGAASADKTYTSVITNSGTSTTANTAKTSNPYVNLIQTVDSKTTVAGKFQVAGIGGIVVAHDPTSTAKDRISISISAATNENVGGIKIGYTASGKKYPVQLADSKAYVEVPWSNTTYGLATKTSDGLVPRFDAVGAGALARDSWVLSKLANGTYDWFALPSTAFTDTWRAVQINGSQILGTASNTGVLNLSQGNHVTISKGSNNSVVISSTWRDITIGGESINEDVLNFIPSGSIALKKDSESDGITNISYELGWYNINSESYEFA